jgi:hypothetical protein
VAVDAALVVVADVPWNQAVDVQAPVVLLPLRAVVDVLVQLHHVVVDVAQPWNHRVDVQALVVLLQPHQAVDVLRQLPAVDVQLLQQAAVVDEAVAVAAVDFFLVSETDRVAVARAAVADAVADVLLQLPANHPVDVRKLQIVESVASYATDLDS